VEDWCLQLHTHKQFYLLQRKNSDSPTDGHFHKKQPNGIDLIGNALFAMFTGETAAAGSD